MGTIALLPQDCRSRGLYLDRKKMPENYMEDFTLLGFVVDDFQEAIEILQDNGFRVVEQPGGADILINSAETLVDIKSLLAGGNIGCEFSDVADTIYQA